jgi:hypothetical protein
VLKNGCCVEELQLGNIERIERALALYLVVAWRIAHLMRMGRTCPDLDAKLFFDPDEIQAACLLNKALAPPAPRLNEVVRMDDSLDHVPYCYRYPARRRFNMANAFSAR